jgi:hypothetical protein
MSTPPPVEYLRHGVGPPRTPGRRGQRFARHDVEGQIPVADFLPQNLAGVVGYRRTEHGIRKLPEGCVSSKNRAHSLVEIAPETLKIDDAGPPVDAQGRAV